jgi:hypothetical protein
MRRCKEVNGMNEKPSKFIKNLGDFHRVSLIGRRLRLVKRRLLIRISFLLSTDLVRLNSLVCPQIDSFILNKPDFGFRFQDFHNLV